MSGSGTTFADQAEGDRDGKAEDSGRAGGNIGAGEGKESWSWLGLGGSSGFIQGGDASELVRCREEGGGFGEGMVVSKEVGRCGEERGSFRVPGFPSWLWSGGDGLFKV